MGKKIQILFFTLLFLLPFVSAETPITIKTLKNHDISIFVLKNSQVFSALDIFHVKSGDTGMATVTTTTSDSTVDLLVTVYFAGVKIAQERYEDVATGAPLTFELPDLPDEVAEPVANSAEANETAEPETNETVIAEETVAEEVIEEETQEDSASGITGGAVGKSAMTLKGIYAYAIIGVFLVGAVVFTFVRKAKMSKRPPGYNIPSSGFRTKPVSPQIPQLPSQSSPSEVSSQNVEDLERRIKEMQQQVNRLKNEDRIKEVQKRLDADREELEKLRGE